MNYREMHEERKTRTIQTTDADNPVKGLRILVECCSGACPTQLYGWTEDGRHVYGRYRGGCLTVGVGDTEDEAVDDRSFIRFVGDYLDGYMTKEAMLAHTGMAEVT